MIPETFGLVIAVLIGLWGAATAANRERLLRHTIVSFGRTSPSNTEAETVLFLEYVRQQRWSFGLLWFSVAAGVVLLIIVIARIILSDRLDLTLLGEAAGLTLDIGVAAGAAKLYQIASKRLETAAKNLAK